MIKVACIVAVTIAAFSMAACAAPADSPVDTPPATAPATEPDPISGDAILIETRITDARQHLGEVVAGSVIGEAAFCAGGTTTGSSVGPTITTTFDCPDGSLLLQYSPKQVSLVQGAAWEVVSGTGEYEGLSGGGSMVAVFDSDDPDAGREIFTGQVART